MVRKMLAINKILIVAKRNCREGRATQGEEAGIFLSNPARSQGRVSSLKEKEKSLESV